MKILVRTILILGSLFILTTTALTLFFQTEYGKKKLTNYITQQYGEGDFSVTFEKVSGALPFQWTIKNAYVRISSTQSIFFEEMTFRPYFWRLLRKEIAFHEISAKGGSYIDEDPTPSLQSIAPDIPVTLYVKIFSVEDMGVTIADKPRYQFDATGSLRITQKGRKTSLTVSIKGQKTKESSLSFTFTGIKNGRASLQIDAGIQIEELYPSQNLEGLGNISASLAGSWQAFNELLTTRKNKFPIQGSVEADIYYIKQNQFHLSYPLTVRSQVEIYSDLSLDVNAATINSALANLTFSTSFGSGLSFKKAFFEGQLQPSLIEHWDGPIYVRGEVEEREKSIRYFTSFDSPIGKVWRWPFERFTLDIKGNYADSNFSGSLESYLDVYAREWKGDLTYFFHLPEKKLYLDNLQFYSPFSLITGSAQLQNRGIWADLDLSIADLSQMQPFFPFIKAFGSVKGDLALYPDQQGQLLFMDLRFFDSIFSGLHTQNALLTLEVEDLWEKPSFDMVLQAEEARYRGLQLQSLSLSTQTVEEKWPFSIALKGESQNPIDLLSQGFWKIENDHFSWDVQKLDGFFFDQAFSLQKPTQVEWKKNYFQITPFVLQMPENQIEGNILLSPEETDCKLSSPSFPLSLLSLNPWNVSIQGLSSIDFSLQQKKKQEPLMKLVWDIFEISLSDQADLNPLYGSGKINSSFASKKFSLDSSFIIRETEKIALELLLPIEVESYPLQISYPRYGNLLGSFLFDARVEDILDYINIGPHRIEGGCKCELDIGGTWRKPTFTGKAIYNDGKYDNYYTGSSFGNLYASFIMKDREVEMTKFTGDDGMRGLFNGKGSLTLSLSNHFPFDAEISFKNLQVVDIDLVQAKANGFAEISGNSQKALAKGEIDVSRADFTIPDKITFPVPSLPVTYINQGGIKNGESFSPYAKKPYPLELDFTVKAPDDVYISGRGLSSQWKGDFSIGGTYDNIIAKGDLELVRGDFLFAGKTFNLTTGILTFAGEANEPPFLQITGNVEQSGITIITQLRGKLTEPRLTFRALPPLPVSSILSYLIFGQDISEISPLQAAQLATTAASLSGEGPDILELARKSLGLDRLAVVSTPTKEGVEGAAIQIGKYLAKGLLFSISQGPNPSLGNLSVEVDLTHGFIFEAESMVQQEQGKFSLKWHKNY